MSDKIVFRYIWEIKDFYRLSYSKDVCLNDEENTGDFSFYSMNAFDPVSWWLKLKPNGDDEDVQFISLSLKRCEDTGRHKHGTDDATVNTCFNLLNTDGNVFFSTKPETKTFRNSETWKVKLISVQDLQKEMRKWAEDTLTIEILVKFTEDWGFAYYTDLKTMEYNSKVFTWRIKDPCSPDWLQTKTVTISELDVLKITLTAPDKDIIMEYEYKSWTDPTTRNSTITCKWHLIDMSRHVLHYTINTFSIAKRSNNNIWKVPTDLMKRLREEKYTIVHGYFTLVIEVFFDSRVYDGGSYIESSARGRSIQSVDVLTTLQSDFKQMFSDRKFADVTLKADAKLFPAHKCVLSSRSPVFAAMFDSGMLENRTNIVEITDLDAETLSSLLNFLYSGITDTTDFESTVKLIIAADKYQVQSLSDKCAELLIALMCETENYEGSVLDVYKVGDMLRLDFLKSTILHHLEFETGILETEEFHKWAEHNSDLAREILSIIDITNDECSTDESVQTE